MVQNCNMTDVHGVDAPAARGDLLATASRLESDGDLLGAIDALMAANRIERDPGVEFELTKLRHAAFGTLPRYAEPAAWPPPVPGPQPGLDESGPMPEIAAADLTVDAVRRAVFGHGSLIVRGVLDAATVDELKEGIDRALGLEDGVEVVEKPPAPWYQPLPLPPEERLTLGRRWVKADGGVLLADSPHLQFTLLEAYRKAGLFDLVTGYLGERPSLSANKSTLRRVSLGKEAGWHQDGAFLGQGIHALNIWLALSHCGDTAPGMDILPRRFEEIVETGTGGSYFDWGVGPAVVEQLAVETPIVRPIFDPGDLCLFDEMLLHSTAIDDAMTDVRYAVEAWCFGPSAYPDGQVPVVW